MSSIIKSIIFAAFLVLPVKGVYASVWQSPVVIDSGHEDAYRTDIKFDSDGNALAVFEQEAGGMYRLYSNRYIKGKGWDGPVVIDADTGNAYRGRLAIDGSGNAIVVFKQGNKGSYRVYANMYIKGRGWQGANPIDSGQGLVDGQEIVFNAAGGAAAVFEQHNGKSYGIYANFYIQGKGWQGPVKIDDEGDGNAFFPAPIFDGQGNLHVVYYKESSGVEDFYAVLYDAQKGQWAKPAMIIEGVKPSNEVRIGKDGAQEVERNPMSWGNMNALIYSGDYTMPSKKDARKRDAFTPGFVVSPDGEVTVFFVRWDRRVKGYAAGYRKDSGWGEIRLIDADKGDVEHIRGAVNSKGDIAVVFAQVVEDSYRIHTMFYRQGPGWGEAKIIDSGPRGASNPSIAFINDDSIIATWCQWDKKKINAYANTSMADAGWGVAKRLDKDDGETCGVRLATGPEGSAIAIFEQGFNINRRPTNRILATVFDSSPEKRKR